MLPYLVFTSYQWVGRLLVTPICHYYYDCMVYVVPAPKEKGWYHNNIMTPDVYP